MPGNIEAEIDSIFSQWNDSTSPGASIGVMHNGELLFSKGYGMANLEYDIPNESNTVFHIASVSKQFTAFAILLLQEEGKLSIDDDIRDYIPEVPDFGPTITLRHLVTHTSGMRDQWNLLAMAGWRLDDVITKEHVMSVVAHQKELNTQPGERYNYCNTGFTLLAEVVSRLSDQTFAEFTKEHIFDPLGMDHTLFYDDHMKIVKNRAYSYQTTNDGFQKRVLSYANVGATSLFTTADDLLKWADNFRTVKIGSQEIFDQMNTEAVLNDGTTFGGAMGQFIQPYNGHMQIQHGGADAGYRSYLCRFPEFGLSICVLSNLGEFNPVNMSLQVADLFLPAVADAEDSGAEVSTNYNYVKLSNKKLKKFEGDYWNEEDSYSRRIYLKDDTLRYDRGMNESSIVPISDHEFRMVDVSGDLIVSFTGDKGKQEMAVTVDGDGPFISQQYKRKDYTLEDLKQYEGDYYSEELNTNYVITATSGGLIGKHFRHGDMLITPAKGDLFQANRWYFGNVEFTRNKKKKVNGLLVSNGRVMNLRFVKKD